jgi:heptosyltransferase II
MSRSLVVAPQWIGDAVMCEPLLALLAARGETLTVAALPWVAPVFGAMAQVREIVELPFAHGRLDLAARMRIARALRGRFDAAYVLPNSLKAALVPWLARIPLRVGYVGEMRHGLLNRRLPNPAGRPPMVAWYAALAGGLADPAARPHLALDAARIGAACAVAGVEPGAYWVFAPGAEFGPAKCWPAAHYASLAQMLHAESSQPVLLLGSPKEAALCDGIAEQAGGACRVLAGRTALAEAMALIAGARGMASNDSGLMHVAAAFGIAQTAMFGSTSPEHTPPLNPRARVLWLRDELGLDCMPCFDRVCRFGHTRCLTGISPGRAHAALQEALAEG